MKKSVFYLLIIVMLLSIFAVGCAPEQTPPLETPQPSGSPSGTDPSGTEPSENLPDPIKIEGSLENYINGEEGDVYIRTDSDFEMIQTDANSVLGNPDITSITIEGVGENVKFTVKGSSYASIKADGNAKLTFKNLTIIDQTEEGGNWDMGWYLGFGGKVRFENCTMTKIIFKNCIEAEVVNCKVYSGSNTSRYCLWVADGDVTINGSEFSGYRGIKINKNVGEIGTVLIQDCAFDITQRVAVGISVVNTTTVVKIFDCEVEGVTPVDVDYDEGIDGLFEIGKKGGDYDFTVQISGNKVAGFDVDENDWYQK